MTTIPADVKVILDFTIGDGYLGIYNNTEYPKFRMEHSIKQKDYIEYKNRILETFGFKLNYRIYKSNNPKQFGKEYCRTDIYGDSRLKTARKYLYNKRIKTVDKKLLNQLNAESLAFWFMDDGCAKTIFYTLDRRHKHIYEKRKCHSYKLSTNCFQYSEVCLISDWLKEKFDISSTVSKTKEGPVLNVYRTEEKDKFRNLISPYIIESMRYKISYPHSFIGIESTAIPRNYRREETERSNSEYSDEATVQLV